MKDERDEIIALMSDTLRMRAEIVEMQRETMRLMNDTITHQRRIIEGYERQLGEWSAPEDRVAGPLWLIEHFMKELT